MTPFSIQNIYMKLNNFQSIKNNIVEEKFDFCKSFEKEMSIGSNKYSEDIFDFLYNLTDHKRVFKGNRLSQILSDFLDMDFSKFMIINEFINEIYKEMAFLNRDYFYEIFKFDHNDPVYIAEKFGSKLQENIEKFINNF